MSCFKYPSIEQFYNVITELKYHYGADADVTLPFTGTVKLHGSNGGVAWDGHAEDLTIQSRNRVISVANDNAGFAQFVTARTHSFKNLFQEIFKTFPLEGNETAYLYGEWCGKGIQKGVAISEVDKLFVMFNVVFKTNDDDNDEQQSSRRWLPASVFDIFKADATVWPASDRLYNIYQFSTWTKNIHFVQPDLGETRNEIVELTNQVEAECPVGKYFGVSGVGEGIVWTTRFTSPRDGQTHHFRFKVKGAKHSVSKVKTLAAVDTEKLKTIDEFLDYAVTDNRMDQGYDELFIKTGQPATIKNLGTFIKWVRDDVIKEETDTLEANGLLAKDIGKPISTRARQWFETHQQARCLQTVSCQSSAGAELDRPVQSGSTYKSRYKNGPLLSYALIKMI